MQQFLIYGGSREGRGNYLAATYPASDYLYYHLSGVAGSLKISEVRALESTLAIAPPGPRLVWIEEAGALTLPAQHALLKTLEEPPPATTLVLTVNHPGELLATVVSRLGLVRLAAPPPPVLDSNQLSLVKEALSSPAGRRVQLAQSLGKNRPDAEAYLTSVIHTLYGLMQQESSASSLKLLAKISQLSHLALERTRANVNVQLALESFFLTLPRTR